MQPGEARFGAELDWVKPWRGQGQDERDQWKQTGCARKTEENGWRHVFGAKIGARNERTVFFLGIQRERLAWKVQPGEARFRPELDWEKPWRGQVFGAKMSETNGNKLDAREKWKTTVGGTCSGPQEKCISRSTKYCLPQKTSRSTKTVPATQSAFHGPQSTACHEIFAPQGQQKTVPATKSPLQGPQSTATKFAFQGPQNTLPDVKFALRSTKYCACHETSASRSTKYCACHEICTSKVLHLQQNLHFKAYKVLHLP